MRELSIKPDVMNQDRLLLAAGRASMFGCRVVVSEHIHKSAVLQVSPSFTDCTDGFRQAMNAWLLDKFGTRDAIYLTAGKTIFMSPEMNARLAARIDL